MKTLFGAAVVLAVVGVGVTVPVRGQSAPYRLEWLGQDFYPYAVNDRGRVIGHDFRGYGSGPALLWENGVVTDIGPGVGNDINNHGAAVLSVPGAGVGRSGPIFVAPDGTRTDPNLRGWSADFRHQFSINDAGHVVGMDWTTGTNGRAFRWDGAGVTYLDFGVPTDVSSAQGISNGGHVVGWRGFQNSPANYSGYLWRDNLTTFLASAAVGVNDAGRVLLQDAVWDGGVTTPIPALPLLPRSDPAIVPRVEAREINNAGQVAGWSEEMYLINLEDGHGITNRAFLWDPVNGTLDLNALMGFGPDEVNQMPLSYALDVNNGGQIVGFGTRGGWILTPVPEPGGALSALAGLWLLGISRSVRRARVPLDA
jgi:probable HAF family extracellular repeat protein